MSSLDIATSEPETPLSRRVGLFLAGTLGALSLIITGLATPFILPALRRHCLPFVPATDSQLDNIVNALRKHATPGGRFLDIGSGDGRVCRASASLRIFSQVEGVELNYPLVVYSRISTFKNRRMVKFHHKDLWSFPLADYDTLCIFGVESIMKSLEERLLGMGSKKDQTICACRFPFANLNQIDEIGSGIDTVWVYELRSNKSS